MVEVIKTIAITGVMGTIARIGGRKYDQYMIFMVGAVSAGVVVIQGCLNIASVIVSYIDSISAFFSGIANSQLIQAITNLISFFV